MRSYFVLAVGLGVMLMGGVVCTARAADTSKAATQDVTGTVNDALGRPIPAAAAKAMRNFGMDQPCEIRADEEQRAPRRLVPE